MDKVEVSFPGLGWTFNISNVAFSIGSFDVYWYGIIIALAIVLCIVLGVKQCKENKFPSELIYDFLLVGLPCAIIGARAYYVICEWDYYSKDLSLIFNTRAGGLAVYGGVIGAFLGAFIMCRIRKIPFSKVADFFIVYVPLGQAIGRWGNFFNQEAFGTTTTLPWGMTSSTISSYLRIHCPSLDSSMAVHPTFLYESICTLIIFFILLQVRKRSTHAYGTFSTYLILYGIARFFIEGLRTDSLYIGSTGIRTSQLLSAVLIVIGLSIIAVVRSRNIGIAEIPERFFKTEKKEEVKEEVKEAEAETPAKEESVAEEPVAEETAAEEETKE